MATKRPQQGHISGAGLISSELRSREFADWWTRAAWFGSIKFWTAQQSITARLLWLPVAACLNSISRAARSACLRRHFAETLDEWKPECAPHNPQCGLRVQSLWSTHNVQSLKHARTHTPFVTSVLTKTLWQPGITHKKSFLRTSCQTAAAVKLSRVESKHLFYLFITNSFVLLPTAIWIVMLKAMWKK